MIRRILAGIRDGWLILGLTLVAFLVLEFGYRAVSGSGRSDAEGHAVDSVQHPYANQAWWGPFQGRDGLLSRVNGYDPYRAHWAEPTASRFVNVDSLGRRRTVQYGLHGGGQIWMLGGSTMWGYTARDSFSVPSLTALELADRGLVDYEVVNLAQAAYNSTQELNTVVLELLHHRRPVVAVFLDGYNDIATGWVNGEPGHTYGDQSIDQRIKLGTRGFLQELVGLGRHSAVVQRLQRAAGIAPQRRPTAGPEICRPVADYFRNVTLVAEAIGQQYGFAVRYFLQPVHLGSRKPLTPWEAALPKQRALVPCLEAVDSAMADQRGVTYFSLLDVFDDDTATVFVDQNAHITEAANRKVAAKIVDTIEPLLRSGPPTADSLASAGARPAQTSVTR